MATFYRKKNAIIKTFQNFLKGRKENYFRFIEVLKNMQKKTIHYFKLTKAMLGISLGIGSCSLLSNAIEQVNAENINLEVEEEQELIEEITTQGLSVSNEPITLLAEETISFVEEQKRIAEEINLRQTMYTSYLQEYSGYFHLDSDKVVEIAKMTTNNYEDFTSIIDNSNYDLSNPEAACMLFVYHLNRDKLSLSLEDLGTSKDELLKTNEIEITPHDDLNELYLSNGEKYTYFYGKMCDFFGIEEDSKILALAASFIEISEHGSYSSNNRNNVRGLVGSSGNLMTFSTLEAGIISACGNYESGYKHYNMDSLLEMACYHISGKKELPKIEENDDEEEIARKESLIAEIMGWKSSVSSFYYKISENYDYYFSEPNNDDNYVLARTRKE